MPKQYAKKLLGPPSVLLHIRVGIPTMDPIKVLK